MGCSRFYLICVRGQVSQDWQDWFGGLAQQMLPEYTVLSGSLPDQSALLGILDVIHNLGLTLISVSCLEPSAKGASK